MTIFASGAILLPLLLASAIGVAAKTKTTTTTTPAPETDTPMQKIIIATPGLLNIMPCLQQPINLSFINQYDSSFLGEVGFNVAGLNLSQIILGSDAYNLKNMDAIDLSALTEPNGFNKLDTLASGLWPLARLVSCIQLRYSLTTFKGVMQLSAQLGFLVFNVGRYLLSNKDPNAVAAAQLLPQCKTK